MRELVSSRFVDKTLAAARIALPSGLLVFALAPAGAWGAADVIRNSGYNFDRPTYYSDQGEIVQYEHSGGSPHNVVSTQSSSGEPLFKSGLISTGTTPVNGTQFLAPGTYPFVCTIHFGMAAELVVRSAEPPPDSDPTPPDSDPTPPDSDPTPPDSDPTPPDSDPTPPDSDSDVTTADKATIGKLKVVGPARVKKGKKATYRVRISNTGNATAAGVRLKVKGGGISSGKSFGKIQGGTTRKVKVRVKPKKLGKFKVSFKVDSRNAGARTAKMKVKVRK